MSDSSEEYLFSDEEDNKYQQKKNQIEKKIPT